MGYGEEFQGMSPEMVQVEIAIRLKNIEEKVDNIRCPSPRCQDHDLRISNIERQHEREDSGTGRLIEICGIAIAAAISVIALIVSVT